LIQELNCIVKFLVNKVLKNLKDTNPFQKFLKEKNEMNPWINLSKILTNKLWKRKWIEHWKWCSIYLQKSSTSSLFFAWCSPFFR